jgi:hypothetical protein
MDIDGMDWANAERPPLCGMGVVDMDMGAPPPPVLVLMLGKTDSGGFEESGNALWPKTEVVEGVVLNTDVVVPKAPCCGGPCPCFDAPKAEGVPKTDPDPCTGIPNTFVVVAAAGGFVGCPKAGWPNTDPVLC